jgi:hypothetical protein
MLPPGVLGPDPSGPFLFFAACAASCGPSLALLQPLLRQPAAFRQLGRSRGPLTLPYQPRRCAPTAHRPSISATAQRGEAVSGRPRRRRRRAGRAPRWASVSPGRRRATRSPESEAIGPARAGLQPGCRRAAALPWHRPSRDYGARWVTSGLSGLVPAVALLRRVARPSPAVPRALPGRSTDRLQNGAGTAEAWWEAGAVVTVDLSVAAYSRICATWARDERW